MRTWFDAPAEAGGALEALHTAFPEDDDVAWWLARVWIDQGRAAEARALLVGRSGRKVPEHRFAWLRARASEHSDPAGARAELARALASPALALDPDRTEVYTLGARLAWSAGDEPGTLAVVLAAGGTLPGFSTLERRAPLGPLRVEMDGHVGVVTTGGLVVQGAMCGVDARAPIEAAGARLQRADGRDCLGAGARGHLAPAPGGWGYVALDAPEGQGIFTIAGCDAAPHAVRRGAGLSSPAWLGGTLLWVEGGVAHTGEGSSWPDVNVLRLATIPEGVLAVVWESGAPRLRFAPSPDQPLALVFAEDPPITRATACPSPRAARAPGAPPPRPAHPR
ncbi:MAG: tetratricopeptide repeat protein [Pseudomonadota bacterium]|nr:tetratricopeptide repeat protein [Pseudomonadota bacterium]